MTAPTTDPEPQGRGWWAYTLDDGPTGVRLVVVREDGDGNVLEERPVVQVTAGVTPDDLLTRHRWARSEEWRDAGSGACARVARMVGRPSRGVRRETKLREEVDAQVTDLIGALAPDRSAVIAALVERGLRVARASVADLMQQAAAVTPPANGAGQGTPETQIAALLGVDRMTVRGWLGKR